MNILEGSVQKANDQVRVNVQLINALTYAHLWADTYAGILDVDNCRLLCRVKLHCNSAFAF